MGSGTLKTWSARSVWVLLKKDSLFFLFYLLLVIAATTLLLVEDGMDGSLVMMLGGMVFVTTLGPQFMSEIVESKFEAYRFLSFLPISAEEIVTARFVRSFLYILLFTIYGFALLLLFSPTGAFLKLGSLYFLVLIAICLLIISLLNIGLFRFGFSRMFKFLFAFLPVFFILSPGLIKMAFRSRITAFDTAPILAWFSWPKFLVLAGLVTGMYSLFLVVAIRVQKRSRLND